MDLTSQQSSLRSCTADISTLRVLIAGAGIGSVIAECALRMGFRTLSVIDSGIVNEHDISVNGYAAHELHTYKAWALTERLLEIDPEATICFSNIGLTPENIRTYVRSYDVVVNTFMHNSTICMTLDEHCAEMGILSIHPYNLDRTSLVFCMDIKVFERESVLALNSGSYGEKEPYCSEIFEKSWQDSMGAAAKAIAVQVCQILRNVASDKGGIRRPSYLSSRIN